MKSSVRNLFLVCSMGMTSSVLFAQNNVVIDNEMPNSIMLVSVNQAGDEIIRILNENQLPHFHDTQAPRFLLTDREGNYALGIGGYVRAVAEYDLGGIVDDVDFAPALIPNHSDIRNQFQMDASTANLFLKLVGRSDLLGDFIVHTEGNFRGTGNTFKLRNAYIAFRNVTLGYTYGGFMDAAAMPSTIDFQGPNGATFYRTTQLAYTYKGWSDLWLNASVEMPEVSATSGGGTTITHQRLPDFTAYVQYNCGYNSHLRLGGIIRSMTYNNEATGKNADVTGYGVQASAVLGMDAFRFFGQFTYGKGIGRYFNDLGELDVDLVGCANEDGRLQALPMLGWYAGLQYNITPSLFTSATYSMSRLYSENGYASLSPDNYRYGQYLVANLIWNASQNLQLGAEYLRGWRTDFDHSSHHANRICLMAKYAF